MVLAAPRAETMPSFKVPWMIVTEPVKSLAVLRVRMLAPFFTRFSAPLILPPPKMVKLLRPESLVRVVGLTVTPGPMATPVTTPGVSSKRMLSPGRKVSLTPVPKFNQLAVVETSQALLEPEFQRRFAGVPRLITRFTEVVLVKLGLRPVMV